MSQEVGMPMALFWAGLVVLGLLLAVPLDLRLRRGRLAPSEPPPIRGRDVAVLASIAGVLPWSAVLLSNGVPYHEVRRPVDVLGLGLIVAGGAFSARAFGGRRGAWAGSLLVQLAVDTAFFLYVMARAGEGGELAVLRAFLVLAVVRAFLQTAGWLVGAMARRNGLNMRWGMAVVGLGAMSVSIPSLFSDRVLDVSTGPEATCVTTQSGRVWCWGAGAAATFDVSDTCAGGIPCARTPARIWDFEDARTVHLGRRHVCVEHRGPFACRGADDEGQLGIGGASEVCERDGGVIPGCRYDETGALSCEGETPLLKDPIPCSTEFRRPKDVPLTNGSPRLHPWVRENTTCFFEDGIVCAGDLGAWSDPKDTCGPDGHPCARTPIPVHDGEEYPRHPLMKWPGLRRLCGSTLSGCGFPAENSRMAPFGEGSYRCLSDGHEMTCAEETPDMTIWKAVEGLPDERLWGDTGRASGCILIEKDVFYRWEVWCWGDNRFGQLGQGDTLPRDTAVRVDIPPATRVALGDDHVCATTEEGVWCWGRNDKGQVGTGKSEEVVLIPALVFAL